MKIIPIPLRWPNVTKHATVRRAGIATVVIPIPSIERSLKRAGTATDRIAPGQLDVIADFIHRCRSTPGRYSKSEPEFSA